MGLAAGERAVDQVSEIIWPKSAAPPVLIHRVNSKEMSVDLILGRISTSLPMVARIQGSELAQGRLSSVFVPCPVNTKFHLLARMTCEISNLPLRIHRKLMQSAGRLMRHCTVYTVNSSALRNSHCRIFNRIELCYS